MSNKNIVLVSISSLHSPLWFRRERFAHFLSQKGYNVLYVNSPVFLTRRSASFEDMKPEEIPQENLLKISDTLHELVSPIPIPCRAFNLSRFEFFEKLKFKYHYKNIKAAVKDLGWEKVDFHWTYFPQSITYKGFLGEENYVLDWVDKISEHKGWDKKFTARMEKRSIREADLILTTAKGLFDEAKEANKNVYLVPNGVDYDFFQQDPQKKSVLKEMGVAKDNFKAVVTYIGAVADWLDQEMLAKLAADLPDFLFAIFGPVHTDISRFEGVENVIFPGKIHRNKVPQLLKESNVAIIPFKMNNLVKFVNPLKAYEYLAAGCPVVSTPMPEISEFAHVIRFAEKTEDFKQAVIEEAAKNDPESIKKRKEAAKTHDWNTIQERLSEILHNHLLRKKIKTAL